MRLSIEHFRELENFYWEHVEDSDELNTCRHCLNANLGMSAGMSLGGLIRRELRDLD